MQMPGTPATEPAAPDHAVAPTTPDALTDEQQRIVDYYLGPRTGDDLEPPVTTIQVTKRQLAFLLAAIDHFHATACPLARETSGEGPAGEVACCELREWYESPGSGAVALGCFSSCAAWRDALIQQVVPTAFHVTGTPPVHRAEIVAAAQAAATQAARRDAERRRASPAPASAPVVRITAIDTSETVVPAI